MNRLAVVVLLYVLLCAESAMRAAFAPPGSLTAFPLIVLPTVIFVAMYAPPMAAWWTAMLTGLMIDLTTPITFGSDNAVGNAAVLGPNALGFLAAAYFATTIRGMMLKRSVLAMVFVCVLGSLIAQSVIVSFLMLRGWTDTGMRFFAGEQLWTRILCSVYAAGTGALLSVLTRPLTVFLSLNEPSSRRGAGAW